MGEPPNFLPLSLVSELQDKRQDPLLLDLVPGFVHCRHLRGGVGKSQPWLLVDLLFSSRREAERGEREAGREVYFVQRRRNPRFNTSTLPFSDPEQTQEEEEEPAASSQGPQRQTVTV